MEEKEKANDWMWQSHRESQLMIVKRPHTKDKRMLYLYFQPNVLYPPPIKSPTINGRI